MIKFKSNILIILIYFFYSINGASEDKETNTEAGLKNSLDNLTKSLNNIEEIYTQWKTLNNTILTQKKSSTDKVNKLANTLLEEDIAITKEDSKNYYNVVQKIDELSKQIDLSLLYDKISILEHSVKSAEIEHLKYPGIKEVKDKVDEIVNLANLAKEKQHELVKLKNDINKEQKQINNKINFAIKDITQFSFGKEALDQLIEKTKNIDTLDSFSKLINDDRFFNLTKELQKDPNNGQKIFDVVQQIKDIIIGIGQTSNLGIIKKANSIFNDLNQKIANAANQPTKNNVRHLAHELNSLLEAPEFDEVISKSIMPAIEIRKTSYQDLFGKKPPGSGAPTGGIPTPPGAPPPPPAGAMGIANPKEAVDRFLTTIDAIKEIKAQKYYNQIISNLKPIENFYAGSLVTELKTKLKNAKDGISLKTDYNRLLEKLYPFSLDSIKMALSSNSKDDNDELKFEQNLAVISKQLSPSINRTIAKANNDIIKARMNVLKTAIDNDKDIKNVDAKIKQIQAAKTKEELTNRCNELETIDVLAKVDCSKIDEALQGITADSAIQKVLDALSKAKNAIIEKYQEPRDEVSSSQNKTQFFQALTRLNKVLKVDETTNPKVDKRIDHSTLPVDNDYTVNMLIDDAIISLKNKNISIKKDIISYEDAISLFDSQIFSAMSYDDIKDLGDKIVPASNDNLALYLRAALSDSSYRELVGLFSAPKDPELIEEIKKAAKEGIKDLKEALITFENSFDDASSKEALLALAEFFKDSFKQKIKDIAHEPDKILNLSEQVSLIKTKLAASTFYQDITFIAELDPSQVETIELTGPPGTPGLIERIARLPDAVREPLLALGDLGQELTELKNSLTQSLQALLAQYPYYEDPQLRLPSNVIPIINAFTLLFLYPLDELNKLTLDGSDDDQLARINNIFNQQPLAPYINQFYKFKSVVGKTKANDDYPIVKNLINIYDKLTSSISTSPALTELKNKIASFLQ